MKNNLDLSKKEAEATVRKTKDGKYIDLCQQSLTAQGKKHLDDEQLMELFKRLRLRFTLTPKCNMWCVFCSIMKALTIPLSVKVILILAK